MQNGSSMPEPMPPGPASGWREGVLRLLRGAALLTLLPALFMAMISGMVFDASGAEKSAVTRSFWIGLVSAPLIALCTAVLARSAMRRFTRAGLIIAAGLPLAWMAYMASTIAALSILCAGEFVCAY